MKIGIDGNEANIIERVGVNIYTYELLKYFSKISSKKHQFIIYLKNKPLPDLPNEKKYFQYKVIPGCFLWSRTSLPIYLLFNKPDILFCPAHYSPMFSTIPTVVTIHDLSYEFYPNEFKKKDLYTLKNWTRKSINSSSHIIAVSKNTKKDIVSLYNVPEEKITVIYNGFTKSDIPQSNKYAIDLKYPFILYVGTIQPRKNIERLIRSFSIFNKKHKDIHLVIAGKKGWLYDDIFASAIRYNIENKILFLGYVDDNTKIWLYKNAKLFILPSLYEGFGIPLLEAMSHKCPTITSNSSSLPEICGNACLYFNPTSALDISKTIEKLISNEDLRKKLIEKGSKKIKEFSWEKCAKQTIKVIEETFMRIN